MSDSEVAARMGIDESEVAQMRGVFNQLDANNDGKLDPEEVKNALNMTGNPMCKKAMMKVVGVCDKDGDGELSFEEFCVIVSGRMKARFNKDNMSKMFENFDANSDGFISAAELQSAWSKMGDTITLEQAEAIVAEADENADGKVSFEEFVKMWGGGGV